MESRYCYEVEVQAALRRHMAGLATVMPVILRPCSWQETPFARLQVLPSDAKPISQWAIETSACRSPKASWRGSMARVDARTVAPPEPRGERPRTDPRTGAGADATADAPTAARGYGRGDNRSSGEGVPGIAGPGVVSVRERVVPIPGSRSGGLRRGLVAKGGRRWLERAWHRADGVLRAQFGAGRAIGSSKRHAGRSPCSSPICPAINATGGPSCSTGFKS